MEYSDFVFAFFVGVAAYSLEKGFGAGNVGYGVSCCAR